MGLLQEQPKRMARERRLLVEHARATPGFTMQGWGKTTAGELCLNFNLKLALGSFAGFLVYPDLFPDVPPYIRPQKSGESWSRHQYKGSGVLCLQYGPDNWHVGITGVDLVRSANQLLWGEILVALQPSLGPVPSRHTLTLGQDLRGSPRRFLVTPGLRHTLNEAQGGVPLKLNAVVTHLGGSAVAVPTAVGVPLAPIPDVPQAFSDERFAWSGWAVPVGSTDTVGPAMDINALKSALGPAWPWTAELGDQLHPLLLYDAQGGFRPFVLSGGSDPLFQEYRAMDFGGDGAQRLPEAFSKLSDVTVAIIGLGSLGSKIAVSLARTGVRRFLLIDDDVLAPHNLVRNELNWLDVGFSKVDAVARELKRVAIGVEVPTHDLRIAGQENPQLASMLGAKLAKCGLVVDATASPQAFVALAALAKRARIPMVWGEVFGGGGGVLMARSRPGLDADPLSIRAHIHGVMETMSPVRDGPAKDYGLEAEGRVYVASDADVMALAASMTQFALDIVCAIGESAYPVSAYLIGFRKYWEFQYPFDTIPIDCSGAPQPAAEPEQLTATEAADLAELSKAMEVSGSVADNSSR